MTGEGKGDGDAGGKGKARHKWGVLVRVGGASGGIGRKPRHMYTSAEGEV
jgi:hypothetical protein